MCTEQYIFIKNAFFERLRTGGGTEAKLYNRNLARGKKSRLPASSDTTLTALESVRAAWANSWRRGFPPTIFQYLTQLRVVRISLSILSLFHGLGGLVDWCIEKRRWREQNNYYIPFIRRNFCGTLECLRQNFILIWLYFLPTVYIAEKGVHIWSSVQILPATVPANRVWQGGKGRCHTLQRKSHLCIPFLEIAWPQSQFPRSCVSNLYVPRIGPPDSTYVFDGCKIDRSGKYINLSQINKCRNWETEHYTSVLEIGGCTVSFLGIHEWQPDINIGFSPAIHLQCIITINVYNVKKKNHYRLLKKQCFSLHR